MGSFISCLINWVFTIQHRDVVFTLLSFNPLSGDDRGSDWLRRGALLILLPCRQQAFGGDCPQTGRCSGMAPHVGRRCSTPKDQ
jgi:hypothetical protein